MEDETTTATATTGKRGRKAGTPDTVKIPIQKLLEISNDRLIVPVNRKWLEFLVSAYSEDDTVDLAELVNSSIGAADSEPDEKPSFEVSDAL